MITLVTFAPSFGQPAASPFCVKAIWLLNMSGQPWQREDIADPRSVPRQKLPALRAGDDIIPDSDNIRHYLEQQGADFDRGLSELDKATSRAFIRMAEEHMYFHVVLDRWGDDSVWPTIRDTYFGMIPRLLRGIVTRKLRKTCLDGMHAQGLGRLSPQERLARIEPDLQAITTRLWHGRFLFGDQPTAADASVAAMLANMIATPGQTLLKTRISEDAVLRHYVERSSDAMGKPSNAASAKLCA
ncbi:Glutathione S-transferase [Sulfitobacter noctilucicola]|uniref:Glutathione S-transferase n=1 Tax=Sulfitobacter noctilucicola TaxID=1342301 RepID=A0A7W6Q423_9RHOB|nr:glutathione S-transferase family protein [Sulfitobacter noctilucicola]KIN62996.1 Glutathione S-transferase [Sulfitobacter noctilucicola]MBB4172477.1 glutathione S-transferase [Sulfitobacter noctilucicola]